MNRNTSCAKVVKVVCCLMVSIMVLSTVAVMPAAAGDKRINIQGKLTDGGNPATGTRTMIFKLYPSGSGTPVWGESRTVTFTQGLYNASLGSSGGEAVTGLTFDLDVVPFNQLYEVGITVSGDASEMSPRTVIGASGYALGSLGDFSVNGNIGIGTGYPLGKLHIAGGTDGGKLMMTGSTSSDCQIEFHSSYSGANKWWVLGQANFLGKPNDFAVFENLTGSAQLILKGDTGRFGIGTFDPGAKMEIVEDSAASVTALMLTNNYDSAQSIDRTVGIEFQAIHGDAQPRSIASITAKKTNSDTTLGTLYFNTSNFDGNNLTRMTITPDGKVGIGTETPEWDLHLRRYGQTRLLLDSIVSKPELNFRSGSNATNMYLNESGDLGLWTPDPSGCNFIISKEGNVGIGGVPSAEYKLYVYGPAFATEGWHPSDMSLKTNVNKISTDSLLAKLEKIDAITYKWDRMKIKEFVGDNKEVKSRLKLVEERIKDLRNNKDEVPETLVAELNALEIQAKQDNSKGFSEKSQIGLSAQSLEKQFPELVNTDKRGYKAVNYTKFTVILLEGIKELRKEVDTLKAEIKKLK